MKKMYSVDQYKDTRRVRPEMVVLAIVLLLGILIFIFVFSDLRKNKTVINEIENTPVLGQVTSNEDPYKTISTEHYQVDIPLNWKVVEDSPTVIVAHSGIDGQTFTPDRYEGTTDDHVGRRLDIYYGDIPQYLPVSHVLEVDVSGLKILPKELSLRCRTYTDTPETIVAGNPYPSRWHDIDFTCKTSQVSNIVSALETNSAEGLVFKVGEEEKSYAIVYQDHGRDTNNDIFFKILRSFRAK